LIEAGCYGMTVGECHLPNQNPNGQVQRDTYSAKSDYFSNTLPHQGIDMLVSALSHRQMSSKLGKGGILLDAYGGALNRVAADATAFVHRNELFSAQYLASWNTNDSNSVVSKNHSWLAETWQSMRQYASGAAYQNYIDPELANWQSAYYGANLPRLQSIKSAYDPDNLFHFRQSIPPTSGPEEAPDGLLNIGLSPAIRNASAAPSSPASTSTSTTRNSPPSVRSKTPPPSVPASKPPANASSRRRQQW